MKTPSQTFVEFVRDKANLFDKWCAANKEDTFEQLKELILLEEFKGVIGCYIHFYKLFELKCVLAVCVHNHPIMIKSTQCFFLIY